MVNSLDLRLLGAPSVMLGNESVTGLRYSKAQALLCYLAITARPHTREALAALLWTEMREDAARTNLRTVLSKLRGRLACCLVVSRQTLAFDRACSYELDVERFIDLLREPEPKVGDLRAAVELYRGELLEGFSVQDAPLFDEWLTGQRELLREKAIGALHRLAVHHANREEHGAAIDYLIQLLALDPWREDVYRHLMRLLAASGRVVEALNKYQELRDVLEHEFDLEPSAETVGLYERLSARGTLAGKATGANAHNLPSSVLPFIARRETDEIIRILGEPDCRLLTLVGPGGIGKTRLACEAVPGAVEQFHHGAWFVALASLTSATELAPSILEALGLTITDVDHANEELLAYLANKQLLLVLDNFEQLLSGARLVANILSTAPGVKLLVTSRERLNVQGEWTLDIEGMDLPGAVRLFTATAERAKPGIRFTNDEIDVIEGICESVGMLPLAVELAAAWVRTLSPHEIASEIGRDLDMLTAPRGAPKRHSSIRQVFEHSWDLLTEEEKSILRRSSVFRGGFSREAAKAVTGASLPELSGLVDKALLSRDANGRYWRHVLVKRFLDEKAARAPTEAAQTGELHCGYYFGFLRRHEQALSGRKQRQILDSIVAELDNIRQAWAHAVAQGCREELERVLPSFETLYMMQGRFREAAEMLAECAVRFSDQEMTASRVRTRQARFEVVLGRYQMAESLLRRSLSLFEQRGALQDVTLAMQLLGGAVYQQGRYAESKSLTLASLSLYREVDDPLGIADSLNNLGNIAELSGEYEEALRFHWDALALRREIRDYRGVAVSLVNLGDVSSRTAELGTAEAFYLESVELRRQIGEHGKIASSLSRLGDTALARGNAERAGSYYRQALKLSIDIHAPPRMIQTLLGVAKIRVAAGRKSEALEILALIVDQPAAQRWYREQAEVLAAELCAELPAAVVAAARAKAASKDLVEYAEELLDKESVEGGVVA